MAVRTDKCLPDSIFSYQGLLQNLNPKPRVLSTQRCWLRFYQDGLTGSAWGCLVNFWGLEEGKKEGIHDIREPLLGSLATIFLQGLNLRNWNPLFCTSVTPDPTSKIQKQHLDPESSVYHLCRSQARTPYPQVLNPKPGTGHAKTTKPCWSSFS